MSDAGGTRGIYGGFEAYRTPSDEELGSAATTGVVVPDTNVLLNLYRYADTARADLVVALTSLGSNLWVPHQVMLEFWRNREAALLGPLEDADDLLSVLAQAEDQVLPALTSWAQRVGLGRDQISAQRKSIESSFSLVRQEIDVRVPRERGGVASNTQSDKVLTELENLLAGKVGPPLSDTDQINALKEADRRTIEKLPPGYKDSSSGDYLVWEQSLRESEARECSLMIITADVKEDWWRRVKGMTRGPRPELVQEMLERTGKQLYLVQPDRFLAIASQFLSIPIDASSVDDVARVDRISSGTGWSLDALTVVMKRLEMDAPVQAAVVRAAAAQGGFVDRAQVYELGEYDETRMLRGFSRPAIRIARELRQAGQLDPDAPELLNAVYSDSVSADGFSIPPEVVELLNARQG